MAALASSYPTLLDIAKATDPDGRITAVVELLMQDNEMLQDIPWVPGNLLTGHRHSVRTGIPLPTFTKIYGWVYPDKATQVQVDDQAAMLEAVAEIDARMLEINNNTAAYLASQSRAFLEGFNQTLAQSLLFANQGTQPEAFTGLAPRFNDLSADNAENIIDAGGTGTDNTSIWIVNWREDICSGMVPKDTTAGFQMKDVGEETKTNPSDGGLMRVRRIFYKWNVGLIVPDWRGIVRICNIDKSALDPDPITNTSSANLPELLFDAMSVIPSSCMANTTMYMSRKTQAMLGKQLSRAVRNSTLTTDQVGGIRTTRWEGIPIRRMDCMAADETRVV